jgi:hypothetical protein
MPEFWSQSSQPGADCVDFNLAWCWCCSHATSDDWLILENSNIHWLLVVIILILAAQAQLEKCFVAVAERLPRWHSSHEFQVGRTLASKVIQTCPPYCNINGFLNKLELAHLWDARHFDCYVHALLTAQLHIYSLVRLVIAYRNIMLENEP